MISGSAEVADYELRKIYDTTSDATQYLRIEDDLNKTEFDPDMDNDSQENMQKLKVFGKQFFEENKGRIERWLKD